MEVIDQFHRRCPKRNQQQYRSSQDRDLLNRRIGSRRQNEQFHHIYNISNRLVEESCITWKYVLVFKGERMADALPWWKYKQIFDYSKMPCWKYICWRHFMIVSFICKANWKQSPFNMMEGKIRASFYDLDFCCLPGVNALWHIGIPGCLVTNSSPNLVSHWI